MRPALRSARSSTQRAASPLPPPCAPWRGPQTAARRWSRSRRSTPPIRCYGTVALDPPGPLADALAQRDGVFGAAADTALLARLDLKPGARIGVGNAIYRDPRRADGRARQARGRHRLRPAPADRDSEALRATGLLQPGQPGALALPARACPTMMPTTTAVTARYRRRAAQLPDAGWEIRSAQQRLARARAQRRALHPISSRWSVSPRCWSAASAWPTPSRAISTASATPSPP